MPTIQRREFLRSAGAAAAGGVAASLFARYSLADALPEKSRPNGMRFGLVTYMWGYDWKLPELIANCQKAGADGVELRTTHAHGVEPEISAMQRREVKKRFADSPVKLVGLGSNEDFHDTDPASLKQSIERAKAFIKLSHDVGGTGVKVKPNDLPPGVEQQKTIEQIGRSLNELGAFAADSGQELRLEVHGQCAPLPIMASIIKVADHPNVKVCWNSNPQDLAEPGLKHNFDLVKDRFGATLHAHNLAGNEYPYAELFKLLNGIRYQGWVLIEASDMPKDRVEALARERKLFDEFISA